MKSETVKTLTISLPANFYKGLEQAALEQDRSKNYLIRKAVENYLEDLFFMKKAKEALASDEPIVSLEEVMDKYGLLEKYVANKPKKKSRKNT
jgi:predicted DNA-binding protein